MNIQMASPDITQAEIDAVVEVLRSTQLSFGPKVLAFEEAVAGYVGVRHGVAVSSGTSGLHLSMIAAGVGAGDEVITPSFSFISSANCVLYEGATPVFVDIDPLTGNLDPAAVAAAITPRTKAIIVVHAFGQPADIDPILALAAQHNLLVIEDACEALGAEYKGRRAGALADMGVFAFYPNKQITTGEGGMLVTDEATWADLFRSLRNQGRDVFNTWLTHVRLGYNYRIDEMSAAVGGVQMQRLEDLLAKREQVANWYNARIDALPRIEKPYIAPTTTRMSWFVYVVRCADDLNRDDLIEKLAAVGIPSRPYFSPIHLQPFYRERFGFAEGDFPQTEHAGKTFLALPFSGVMQESEVDYVCERLETVIKA